MSYIWIVFPFVGVTLLWWWVCHQRSLRRRAETMQEAVRNQDFTFRLPTKGLPFGERAMQEALNQLGVVVRHQVRHQEVEAWERLTHVLTHEIMNALAPVASISQSMLGRDDVKGTPLEEGIRAIHATSSQLTAFVDSYRKLSQWQKPMPQTLGVDGLVGEVALLFPTLEWRMGIPEGCTVFADPGMMRQVFINLAKNAMEAGATRMGIDVEKTNGQDGGIWLCVSNDGSPIPAEVRPSVFVPFFTTKTGGTGVGLSLCRKMMTLQGGDLELADQPRPSYHTTFRLKFSK